MKHVTGDDAVDQKIDDVSSNDLPGDNAAAETHLVSIACMCIYFTNAVDSVYIKTYYDF